MKKYSSKNPCANVSAIGATKSGIAGFNVANNFAFSKDLKSQAQELISRIKRNVNADIRDDWKVIYCIYSNSADLLFFYTSVSKKHLYKKQLVRFLENKKH